MGGPEILAIEDMVKDFLVARGRQDNGPLGGSEGLAMGRLDRRSPPVPQTSIRESNVAAVSL